MRSTKKSYPVAIENIQLEAGEYLTFSGFRNYMTAEEVGKATILSVAKDSKDTYVYAHYHGPMSGDNTELDKDMGKSITALQASNLTALNKVVDTEGISLSSDSAVSDGVFKVQ